MLEALLLLSNPKKPIQLMEVTMIRSRSTIPVGSQFTSTFPITTGVRQGDAPVSYTHLDVYKRQQ